MLILNKKIFFGFVILFILALCFFYKEIYQLKEEAIAARQIHAKTYTHLDHQQIYVLDGFHTRLNFQYMSYCDLKKIYTLQEFRNIAYRYPKALHTAAYFYINAHQQNAMLAEANQLYEAYHVISNAELEIPKLTNCTA